MRWRCSNAGGRSTSRYAHWPEEAHRYVFVFRGRAPIQKLTTRMWRRECEVAGLAGVTFHTLRHTWASWQVQSGTPLRVLQDLGGWASLQIPAMYSHLDPGHLAAYADRVLLGPSRALSPTQRGYSTSGASLPRRQVAVKQGKVGADSRDRTVDPIITNDVLYQLS